MKNLLIGVIILFCCNFPVDGQALHLYGGNNHDVYLGCLNCNNYDNNSIWNKYGSFGSPYSQFSIWNTYGTYGSPYNSNSPWNRYGSNPPVIVDASGNFYGYFTINNYKSNRANSDLALVMYKYFDLIRENIDAWYNKIFQ